MHLLANKRIIPSGDHLDWQSNKHDFGFFVFRLCSVLSTVVILQAQCAKELRGGAEGVFIHLVISHLAIEDYETETKLT